LSLVDGLFVRRTIFTLKDVIPVSVDVLFVFGGGEAASKGALYLCLGVLRRDDSWYHQFSGSMDMVFLLSHGELKCQQNRIGANLLVKGRRGMKVDSSDILSSS